MTQAISGRRSMRRRHGLTGALTALLVLAACPTQAVSQTGEVVLSDALSGATYDLAVSVKQTGSTAWKLGMASFVIAYDPLAIQFVSELEEGNWDNNKFPAAYGDQYVARYTVSSARSIEIDFTGGNGSGVFLSLLPTVVGKLRFTVLDPARGFQVRWDQAATVIYDDQGVNQTASMAFGLATAIGDEPEAMPTEFALEQNYPNPFNPATTIRYALPQESRVSLVIYNLVGQQVATLVEETQSPGYHAVTFNADGIASGLYLYRLTVGGMSFTQKMMLVR
jgi:hypothetical protein